MTLKLAETSVVKSRPSVLYVANLCVCFDDSKHISGMAEASVVQFVYRYHRSSVRLGITNYLLIRVT